MQQYEGLKFSLSEMNYTGLCVVLSFFFFFNAVWQGTWYSVKQVTSFYFEGILCSAELDLEIDEFEDREISTKSSVQKKSYYENLMIVEHCCSAFLIQCYFPEVHMPSLYFD